MGEKPVVSAKDTGAFPPEFEAKYDAYKKKVITYTETAYTHFNGVLPVGKGPGMPKMGAKGPPGGRDTAKFAQQYLAEAQRLKVEQAQLRAEAVKLGLANP